MKGKVLITGGAGLIGSHIADLFYENGYDIRIMDNLTKEVHHDGKPGWIDDRYEFIEGDVRNKTDWIKAIKDVDYVSHQAAWGGFSEDYSKMIDSNIKGTVLLFEVIRETNTKIKKIVVASSQAVYGEGSYYSDSYGIYHSNNRNVSDLAKGMWDVVAPDGSKCVAYPIREDFPIRTKAIYGISKYSEETIALTLGKELGIPVVALRYSMTFGPRQSLSNPYCGICSIFSMQIENDKEPIIFEDGEQTRDFLYVKDNALANLCVLEDDRANNEIFNVSTGTLTKISDFVKLLYKMYNKEDMKINITGEFRPTDMRHFLVDSSKLRNLGWKPKYTLEESVNEYVDWFKTQNKPPVDYNKVFDKLRDCNIIMSK